MRFFARRADLDHPTLLDKLGASVGKRGKAEKYQKEKKTENQNVALTPISAKRLVADFRPSPTGEGHSFLKRKVIS